MSVRKWSFFLGTIVCVALSATSAWAWVPAHTNNRTQYHQQARIRQGIRNGELTRREARRLEAERTKIRRDERRFRADGNLSPRERERLQRERNRFNRDIYRQKHDNQDRH